MKKIHVENLEAFAPLVTEQIKELASKSDREILIGLPGGRGSVAVVAGIVGCDDALLKRLRLYLVDERLEGATNLDTLFAVGLRDAIESGRFHASQLHVVSLGESFIPSGNNLTYYI